MDEKNILSGKYWYMIWRFPESWKPEKPLHLSPLGIMGIDLEEFHQNSQVAGMYLNQIMASFASFKYNIPEEYLQVSAKETATIDQWMKCLLAEQKFSGKTSPEELEELAQSEVTYPFIRALLENPVPMTDISGFFESDGFASLAEDQVEHLNVFLREAKRRYGVNSIWGLLYLLELWLEENTEE